MFLLSPYQSCNIFISVVNITFKVKLVQFDWKILQIKHKINKSLSGYIPTNTERYKNVK